MNAHAKHLAKALSKKKTDDRWISVHDASMRRDCSETAIRIAIRRGTINARRKGGRWEVDSTDLQRKKPGRPKRAAA